MSVSSEPLVISIDRKGEYFINLGEEQLPISLMELKNKAKIIYQANPDIEIVLKVMQMFRLIMWLRVWQASKAWEFKNRNYYFWL